MRFTSRSCFFLCFALLVAGTARSVELPGVADTAATGPLFRVDPLPREAAADSPTAAAGQALAEATTESTETQTVQPHWEQMQLSDPPSPRYRARAVYATDRQRMILVGGYLDSQEYCDETWEFDGRHWEQVDIPGPPAHAAFSLAYDINRGVAVFFGGESQTWEYDGAVWREVPAQNAPPIRGFASLTYDINRQICVLFGGERRTGPDEILPQLSGDTWIYDGFDWTRLNIPGPTPRKYHQMVYDRARRRIVLFGGFNRRHLNDTWELRGDQWREIPTPDAPTPRREFALAYDPISRRTLLFGGYPGGDQLWSYDGATWRRVHTDGAPPGREGPVFVYIPTTRRPVIFGGMGDRLLNDMWEFYRGPLQAALPVPPGPEMPDLGPLGPGLRPFPPSGEDVPPVRPPDIGGTEIDIPEPEPETAPPEKLSPAPVGPGEIETSTPTGPAVEPPPSPPEEPIEEKAGEEIEPEPKETTESTHPSAAAEAVAKTLPVVAGKVSTFLEGLAKQMAEAAVTTPSAPIEPPQPIEIPAVTTPALPASTPAAPTPTPAPSESAGRTGPAELVVSEVLLAPRVLTPTTVLAFQGSVTNRGGTAADTWIEFWLSPTRDPFKPQRFLCRSQRVKIEPGHTYNLLEVIRMPYEDIPPGEYYVAVQVDRTNDVTETDETNNRYIIKQPYTIKAE